MDTAAPVTPLPGLAPSLLPPPVVSIDHLYASSARPLLIAPMEPMSTPRELPGAKLTVPVLSPYHPPQKLPPREPCTKPPTKVTPSCIMLPLDHNLPLQPSQLYTWQKCTWLRPFINTSDPQPPPCHGLSLPSFSQGCHKQFRYFNIQSSNGRT